MPDNNVFPIRAFSDNYIWCLHNDRYAVVVDPGDAAPVEDYLQQHRLSLCAILITHHHWDHTNGIGDLIASRPDVPVYGPGNPQIKHISHPLQESDSITVEQLAVDFTVMEVPGHTLDHIAYYGDTGLFCGDTLFSGGCGRLFEGTPGQMNLSLKKLSLLPGDTKVYCTHEYTLANLKFAETVEPHNPALQHYIKWATQQISNGTPTLPSNIAQEKAINPFLRVDEEGIKINVEKRFDHKLDDSEAVFAALRSWKDQF